jgi:hypothetical protein
MTMLSDVWLEAVPRWWVKPAVYVACSLVFLGLISGSRVVQLSELIGQHGYRIRVRGK